MPTYTFACKQCDERLDAVLSFSDDPLTVCPSCGGELRQVFKPAGIVFKGEGWHIKDYASKGGPSGSRGGSGDSTSNEAGGDSSSTAPAASGSSTNGSSSGGADSSTSSSTGSSAAAGD